MPCRALLTIVCTHWVDSKQHAWIAKTTTAVKVQSFALYWTHCSGLFMIKFTHIVLVEGTKPET